MKMTVEQAVRQQKTRDGRAQVIAELGIRQGMTATMGNGWKVVLESVSGGRLMGRAANGRLYGIRIDQIDESTLEDRLSDWVGA